MCKREGEMWSQQFSISLCRLTEQSEHEIKNEIENTNKMKPKDDSMMKQVTKNSK